MTAVPFDTLALARKLEKAGFPAPQAQETSAAVAEAMGSAKLVTQDYFDMRLRDGAAAEGGIDVARRSSRGQVACSCPRGNLIP